MKDLTGAENPTAEDTAKLLAAEIELALKHDRLLKFDSDGNTRGVALGCRQRKGGAREFAARFGLCGVGGAIGEQFDSASAAGCVGAAAVFDQFVGSGGAAAGLDQPLSKDDAAIKKAAELGPSALEDTLVSAMANKNYPAATSAARIWETLAMGIC